MKSSRDNQRKVSAGVGEEGKGPTSCDPEFELRLQQEDEKKYGRRKNIGRKYSYVRTCSSVLSLFLRTVPVPVSYRHIDIQHTPCIRSD